MTIVGATLPRLVVNKVLTYGSVGPCLPGVS